MDHPEKYGFNPKQLLNHLTDIYLHLRGDVLARAIATDERSYRRELFETCTELLRNKNIKSEVYETKSYNNFGGGKLLKKSAPELALIRKLSSYASNFESFSVYP